MKFQERIASGGFAATYDAEARNVLIDALAHRGSPEARTLLAEIERPASPAGIAPSQSSE